MKEKKKQISFVKWIFLATLCSILSVSIMLIVMCAMFMERRITQDFQDIASSTSAHMIAQMNAMAKGDYHYEEKTGKLFKGNTEITDEAFWSMHELDENIHHTFFWKDTRVLTDITDNSGKPVIGSKLTDEKVIQGLKKNGFYADKNVEIYGNKYCVSYTPVKNGDEVVGYLFVGINQKEANSYIWKNVLIFMLFSAFISVAVVLVLMKTFGMKAKEFVVSLNKASDIATTKKEHVTELGTSTNEDMSQINQAIEQVSMAVTEQASQTEEIMGTMEEFAASIDVIMNEVDQTSQVTKNSIFMMKELKEQLESLGHVSEQNSQSITDIAKQVERDGEAVAQISKIIDVINSIAFQITILSFNASVEAARAGEAGKGFAVVADSIKDLSDKTKSSLEEITRIVFEVNEEMRETIASSENLVVENNKVISALIETKDRMHSVETSFEQISTNVETIKNESDAITNSKNEVVERVSSLAATSEENAAMSEEMKASADEVIGTTSHLLREIKQLQDINRIIDEVIALFSENRKNAK